MLKLLLYVSLTACIFTPWGIDVQGSLAGFLLGLASYVAKLAVAGLLLAFFETSIAKMRVFRVGEFLGGALLLGLLAVVLLYVSRGL